MDTTLDTPLPPSTETGRPVSGYQAALMELVKTDGSDWNAALKNVTEIVSEALSVERVSIWLFNDDGSEIACHDLFRASEREHEAGATLCARDFPRYFQALSEKRVVAADDAPTHPDTAEFADVYLKPLGISSMLDVPIWHDGDIVGVICHEQVGPGRTWSNRERNFAASVAEVVSRALESSERRRAEEALRVSETRFRTMFEQSPESIQILSPDGRTLRVNRAFEQLLGMTIEDLRDFNLLEDPQIRELGILPYLQRGFAGEVTMIPPILFDPARTPRAKKHEPRWIQGMVYPVTSADGSIREVIIVHRDVTEQKCAEDALCCAQEELEARVAERTAELARANEALQREIRERVRAEQVLQRSEEQFRQLIENASDIISILNADGTLRYHSPAAPRINGYSDEETIGRSPLEYVHPEDVGRIRETIRQIVANPGRIFTTDFRYRHKDGHWLTMESIARTLSDSSADEGIVVNSRDITERKATQEALERSEEHYRLITENSSDIVSILEPDGAIRYQSPASERIFGYRLEEMLGRNAFEYFHPDDVARTAAVLEALVREPGSTHSAEYRFRHKDGRYFYCESVARTLTSDPAAGIVVNTRDITSRREAEAKLREAEERTRLIVDTALDAVLTMDSQGIITSWNAQAEAVFGWTAEEAIGRRMSSTIIPPHYRDAHEAGLKRFMDSGVGPVLNRRIEITAMRRDGSEFPVELAVTPAHYGGSLSFSAFVRDITAPKQAADELRAAKEMAEEANRAKSEFLSRMSHELRTPMNSILGFAQLLSRKPLQPDLQRNVEHILKAGKHLLKLINEVLDIARIDSNHLQLSLEPVGVCVIVQEVVSLVQPLAAQYGCRLEASRSPGSKELDCFVLADHQRLTQVILNLVSNAVKYNTPGGSVSISCDVVDGLAGGASDGLLGGAEDAGRIRIRVSDTGPGIPQEMMSRLFQPFDRLGAEQSHVEGTGLGLALSKRLVEAMGGEIYAESAPGNGSVFTVELARAESPLERLEKLDRAVVAVEPDEHAEPEKTATVLYIEDNLANLSLIETILDERPGVTLVSALQGRMGFDLAAEHHPDLVLLDLHLPDISGEEVLQRLRSDDRTSDIPVVIISADATQGQIDRLMRAGAHSYLTKPLDVEEFLEALDSILAERTEAQGTG